MINAHDIIIRPIITEESMQNIALKKYTFEVPMTVNKIEIKKAVEEVFGVKVAKVNTMHVLGKIKRMGRNEGRRPSYKKAIVTLAKGSKTIELLEM